MVELCQNFWQAERRKRDSKIRSTVCRFVIKIASAPFVKAGKRKLSKIVAFAAHNLRQNQQVVWKFAPPKIIRSKSVASDGDDTSPSAKKYKLWLEAIKIERPSLDRPKWRLPDQNRSVAFAIYQNRTIKAARCLIKLFIVPWGVH